MTSESYFDIWILSCTFKLFAPNRNLIIDHIKKQQAASKSDNKYCYTFYIHHLQWDKYEYTDNYL